MRRPQVVLGLTVFTVGILSVVRATEPLRVDTNKDAIGDPFPPNSHVSLSLPLQGSENLTYGAVTESPTGRTFGKRAEPAAH